MKKTLEFLLCLSPTIPAKFADLAVDIYGTEEYDRDPDYAIKKIYVIKNNAGKLGWKLRRTADEGITLERSHWRILREAFDHIRGRLDAESTPLTRVAPGVIELKMREIGPKTRTR